MKPLLALTLLAAAALGAPAAAQTAVPSLEDAAFLAGHWRGEDSGRMFEEVWLAPEGGVMSGMARGLRDGRLSVLEYIVIADTPAGVHMRFKHFNADYSTWEGENPPVTLRFAEAKEGDVLFVSDDAEAEVLSIRYFMTGPDTMQADIRLLHHGEPGGFSLSFSRVP